MKKIYPLICIFIIGCKEPEEIGLITGYQGYQPPPEFIESIELESRYVLQQ